MRWRDIRFEKPTEADEASGHIIQKLQSGRIRFWPAADIRGCVAWMPLSELPQPDLPGEIPEGWRPVDKAVESKSDMMQTWDAAQSKWSAVNVCLPFLDSHYYIVPIDQPAPQYRPFANAAEFDGWAFSFWRYKNESESQRRPPIHYNDAGSGNENWSDCLMRRVFADGTPFGVPVSPAEATQ